MSNSKSLLGAIILAVAMFTVWPGVLGGWQRVQALRDAKAEREALLAERTAILDEARSAYDAYTKATVGEPGRAFLALVPIGRDGAELLSALSDIANRSGIQLAEVAVSDAKTTKGEAYQTMNINVNMTGSYSGLRTFLASLEQYVRILNVQSLEVSQDIKTGDLRFSLKADAYFIK